MASFDLAIPKILKLEGGFYLDPVDLGGATNFGISLRFLKTIQPDADINSIKNMTREQACAIYRQYFWNQYSLGDITEQSIAEFCFSIIVNMPPISAIKIIQRALNDFYLTKILIIDGIMGTKTRELLFQEPSDEISLLNNLKLYAIYYYADLVKGKPEQIKFLPGWINRIRT